MIKTMRKKNTLQRVKRHVFGLSVRLPNQDEPIILRGGDEYPPDAPIVRAHPDYFESADSPDVELPRHVAGSTPNPVEPDQAIADRLAAVEAELAELSRPLRTDSDDVDALARKIADRTVRREALELSAVALRRELLISQQVAAERLVAHYATLLGEASNEAETRRQAYIDAERAHVEAARYAGSVQHAYELAIDQQLALAAQIQQLDLSGGINDDPTPDAPPSGWGDLNLAEVLR